MDAAADDLVFKSAWQSYDPQLRKDAEAFWRREGVIEPFIGKRINELCVIAYHGDDPVAVSTTDITVSPTLGHKFFNYRCMVASISARRIPPGKYRPIHSGCCRIGACDIRTKRYWDSDLRGNGQVCRWIAQAGAGEIRIRDALRGPCAGWPPIAGRLVRPRRDR